MRQGISCRLCSVCLSSPIIATGGWDLNRVEATPCGERGASRPQAFRCEKEAARMAALPPTYEFRKGTDFLIRDFGEYQSRL